MAVQQETIRLWYKRKEKPARMLSTLIPDEKVKVDGKEMGDVAVGEAPESWNANLFSYTRPVLSKICIM